MKTPALSQVEHIPETLPRRQALQPPDSATDVLIVGAGPTGMACAIETQKAGFKALLVDKGCLVNSIYHYPIDMVFFTTPELLEIGDIPFTTALAKPTRLEALEYYRRVAEHFDLNIRQYEWVERLLGEDGNFRVTTTNRHDAIHDYRARKIVLATGYYDLANEMDVPGEDLDKVFHYYREPHPYFDSDVVVIGGKNSAAKRLWISGVTAPASRSFIVDRKCISTSSTGCGLILRTALRLAKSPHTLTASWQRLTMITSCCEHRTGRFA